MVKRNVVPKITPAKDVHLEGTRRVRLVRGEGPGVSG